MVDTGLRPGWCSDSAVSVRRVAVFLDKSNTLSLTAACTQPATGSSKSKETLLVYVSHAF